MGAVDGSQEERIGTGMNAGIKSKYFKHLAENTLVSEPLLSHQL